MQGEKDYFQTKIKQNFDLTETKQILDTKFVLPKRNNFRIFRTKQKQKKYDMKQNYDNCTKTK